MGDYPQSNESSKESQRAEIKEQITEIRGRIRASRATFDSSMVDVLFAQASESIPNLANIIKKTQMAALPVTRETRNYLSADEISRGLRTKYETHPVYKSLFERLAIQAVTRLPHPEREKESLIPHIGKFDKYLYETKPEIPYHFTNREQSEGYRLAINQAADLLVQINPEDEEQKKEMTYLFDTLYKWTYYISSPSQGNYDEHQSKVAEDLFIEVLRRLKAVKQLVNQEDSDSNVSSRIATMINQSYAEETRLDDQLYELWRAVDKLDKQSK